MPHHFDVRNDDHDRLRSVAASVKALQDRSNELRPLDDLLCLSTYVSCPRRGLHACVADHSRCWTGVAYGGVTVLHVLAQGDLGGAA